MSELTEQQAIDIREKWYKDGDARYEVVTGWTAFYRVQCLHDFSKEHDEIIKENKLIKDVNYNLMLTVERFVKAHYRNDEVYSILGISNVLKKLLKETSSK